MTTETVDRYKEKRVKSGGRLSTFDQSVRVEGAWATTVGVQRSVKQVTPYSVCFILGEYIHR